MIKINLRQAKIAYLISGIVFLAGIVSAITSYLGPDPGDNETVAAGNFLFVLPMLLGVFIPARNFTKMMNLGGKRMDFWRSCLPIYAIASLAASLVALVFCLAVNPVMLTRFGGLFDLFDIFGFMAHGAVAAFFQMSAFLFLSACAAHILTLIQGRWYGWIADILIVAIISVFTPIAPLRAALVWFFHMIIFHNYAFVQFASCLVLSAAAYALSLIPIKGKNV